MRGLKSKFSIFSENVSLSSFKIIMLTERWLNGDFLNSEFCSLCGDRSVHTSDCSRGGGVLIGFHRSIPSKRLNSSVDVEQECVKLTVGRVSLIMHAVYLPPRSPIEAFLSLSENLDIVSKSSP